MNIREKTVALIDELKATCQSAGLGNDGNEFKIITQVFLYKFLNDKFGYTLKNKDTRYKAQFQNCKDWEGEYAKLSEDEQKRVCRVMGADCPFFLSALLPSCYSEPVALPSCFCLNAESYLCGR